MKAKKQYKTLKVRVKNKHAKLLNQMAFEVNQIWNRANEETSIWCNIPIPGVGWVYNHISAFDLDKNIKIFKNERNLVNLHSQTVQATTEEHGKCRKQFKRSKLRWRTSAGTRKNLGWVPFKSSAIRLVSGQIRFMKQHFGIWDSFGLSKQEIVCGSFSEDSRGRWYCSLVVLVEPKQTSAIGEIGIDLGLKTTAVCSDGTKLERKSFYRNSEPKLANAQRAKKTKLVRSIHAKIKNQRKDAIHKFTTNLVKNNKLIVVGNVSSSKLAKTKMAKSVLDAGWSMLKTQIDYKSKAMQSEFIEINEAYTTQICSSCLQITDSSPKGMKDLGIREWTCAGCGTQHDRDINAAKNILRLGHQTLTVGIPLL